VPALYPYQQRMVAALEGGATLLAAQPGAGKTAVAIEYAKRIEARSAIVYCPAIAQGVWLTEVAKWWPAAYALLLSDWIRQPTSISPAFLIVSYDLVVRSTTVRHWLGVRYGGLRFDLGICDEAHALKTPTTKRTELLYGPRCAGDGLLARCARVILLTGTPCPNGHPSELWSHLHALRPDLLDAA
jgi:SNF2 family DNA or RNA helicase